MQSREEGIQEIHRRILSVRQSLGLKSYKRCPTSPASGRDLPCVFLIEGPDQIIKHTGRAGLGYPAKRNFELVIELIVDERANNIRNMFGILRKAVFTSSIDGTLTPVVAEDTFINENRTEGPLAYGIPNVLVFSLVLDMFYKDMGIN